jgi:thiol-disulfide isomerase/thioredoxin
MRDHLVLLALLTLATSLAGAQEPPDTPSPAPSAAEALLADAEAAVEDGLDAEEMSRLGDRALALVSSAPAARPGQAAAAALDPREALRGAGIAIRLSLLRSGPEADRLRSRAVDRLTGFLSARLTGRQLEPDVFPEEAWSDLRRALDPLRRVEEDDSGAVATPRETVDDADRLLRRVAERAPHDRVRAIVLALRLENRLLIDRLYGGLSVAERGDIAAEIRSAWERWGELRVSDEATFTEAVRWPLRELELLYLGAEAPDIEGVDLHGRPMKLSEYRGRVVLLDFWASWCPPCIAAIPRQKELLARHPGSALAIVGVSGDVEREDGLAAEERHGATWRSFWAYWPGPEDDDAGAEPLPPVKDTWYVRFWPTYYVLDRDGVIRYKGSWDADLSKAEAVIERLLAPRPPRPGDDAAIGVALESGR